ncbi:MAG: 2'-5' RNA ligase family protein [Cyclobacteriaceae bacterium]|nr:2'-5' RNA ligase family protein [Cyclobacteriaceae bacterium]MCH8515873.1 2'-5' RNA ligase family protein [Cyclobacteriaceae bacterium]
MLKEDYQRYFIALIPPEPIFSEMQEEKDRLFRDYGLKQALKSPPHITLQMPFRWKPAKEDILIDSLANFAALQPTFPISLEGFDRFGMRVIFASVQLSDELAKMQRELKQWMRQELKVFDRDGLQRPFHPHLTLAFRDIKKALFPVLWAEYESRQYEAAYLVDQIALLKHDGKQWEVYRGFTLGMSSPQKDPS